jgi:hypothetical protein
LTRAARREEANKEKAVEREEMERKRQAEKVDKS